MEKGSWGFIILLVIVLIGAFLYWQHADSECTDGILVTAPFGWACVEDSD